MNVKHLLILLSSYLLLLCPAQAAVERMPPFPAYQEGVWAYDTTGLLEQAYLNRTTVSLRAYPFPVRAVYLDGTSTFSLSLYARRLFEDWRLPADTMLLVVATDRRKIGIHLGAELKAQLRNTPQEMPLPPAPSANPDQPEAPQEALEDHLDLLPQVVDQLTESLGQAPSTQAEAPSERLQGRVREDLVTGGEFLSSDGARTASKPRPPRTQDIPWQTLGLIGAALAALLLVGGGLWWGWRSGRRWRHDHHMVEKYTLEGQAALEDLERLYNQIEAVMPDFHGYQGETQKKLHMFFKALLSLQEDLDGFFDAFDEQLQLLANPRERADAIGFFTDLESKLEEARSTYDQALVVLGNLRDIEQSNSTLLTAVRARQQAVQVELQEIRKLHPALRLARVQQAFQGYQNDLRRLEKANAADPMGLDKQLKQLQKQLNTLERDAKSLPHLWEQFHKDIKQRLQTVIQRAKSRPSLPAHLNQSLNEVQRLYKLLTVAIEAGDMKQLDTYNSTFTQKLQILEAEL